MTNETYNEITLTFDQTLTTYDHNKTQAYQKLKVEEDVKFIEKLSVPEMIDIINETVENTTIGKKVNTVFYLDDDHFVELRMTGKEANEMGYTSEGWYFWNISTAYVFGPHETKEDAEKMLKIYSSQSFETEDIGNGMKAFKIKNFPPSNTVQPDAWLKVAQQPSEEQKFNEEKYYYGKLVIEVDSVNKKYLRKSSHGLSNHGQIDQLMYAISTLRCNASHPTDNILEAEIIPRNGGISGLYLNIIKAILPEAKFKKLETTINKEDHLFVTLKDLEL